MVAKAIQASELNRQGLITRSNRNRPISDNTPRIQIMGTPTPNEKDIDIAHAPLRKGSSSCVSGHESSSVSLHGLLRSILTGILGALPLQNHVATNQRSSPQNTIRFASAAIEAKPPLTRHKKSYLLSPPSKIVASLLGAVRSRLFAQCNAAQVRN